MKKGKEQAGQVKQEGGEEGQGQAVSSVPGYMCLGTGVNKSLHRILRWKRRPFLVFWPMRRDAAAAGTQDSGGGKVGPRQHINQPGWRLNNPPKTRAGAQRRHEGAEEEMQGGKHVTAEEFDVGTKSRVKRRREKVEQRVLVGKRT